MKRPRPSTVPQGWPFDSFSRSISLEAKGDGLEVQECDGSFTGMPGEAWPCPLLH